VGLILREGREGRTGEKGKGGEDRRGGDLLIRRGEEMEERGGEG